MILLSNKSNEQIVRLVASIHGQTNPASFVLQHPNMDPLLRSWLAEQIHCRKKAQIKHPTLFAHRCIFSKQALEQSTSEAVAQAKIQYLHSLLPFSKLADLTGGMGAETLAAWRLCSDLHYVEPNEHLHRMLHFNLAQLEWDGPHWVGHKSTAEAFLDLYAHETKPRFDLLLLDPDRRAHGTKNHNMEEASPNPFKLEHKLLKLGTTLVVKHSPMADPHALVQAFKHVFKILIIAHKNEVKEVCTIHSLPGTANTQQTTQTSITLLEIDVLGCVHSLDLGRPKLIAPLFSKTPDYIMVPSRVMLKSGYYKHFAAQNNACTLSSNAPYFGLNKPLISPWNTCFKRLHTMPFSEKSLSKWLKINQISKLNVSARGFYMKAPEIEKKWKLAPSDLYYGFFYKNAQNKAEFSFAMIVKDLNNPISTPHVKS